MPNKTKGKKSKHLTCPKKLNEVKPLTNINVTPLLIGKEIALQNADTTAQASSAALLGGSISSPGGGAGHAKAVRQTMRPKKTSKPGGRVKKLGQKSLRPVRSTTVNVGPIRPAGVSANFDDVR